MTRRPHVGITRSLRRGTIMTWLNCLAIWRAGGKPVVLTSGTLRPLDDLDAVVIGGGDDLNPTLYGGEVRYDVRIDEARDQLEYRVLQHAVENELPILGICRGSQLLNVFFGGNLHGDIYGVFQNVPRMRSPLPRKRVHTVNGTKIRSLIQCKVCCVNSLHHQSVNRLGRDFRISACDDHDIVQAIENPKADFMVGVQWHPEMLPFDRRQQNLFKGLISAANAKRLAA